MLPILLTGLDEKINTLIPTILPPLPYSAVYDALARFKTSQQFISITLHEAWQVESPLKAPQSLQNPVGAILSMQLDKDVFVFTLKFFKWKYWFREMEVLHKENWTREVTFSLKKFEKSLIRALKVGSVHNNSICWNWYLVENGTSWFGWFLKLSQSGF